MSQACWIVAVLVALTISCRWLSKKSKESQVLGILLTTIILGFITLFCIYIPTYFEYTGLPDSVTNHRYKTYKPLAFVVLEHHILVYDIDGRVYTLDGISLEKGLTPETLNVGSNISYTVYSKGKNAFFGRL